MAGLNNCLFVDLITDFSVFLVLSVNVSFMDDGDVVLFNEGSMLLVNNGLMMLVDVLFIDHWLMVLMDNILMMLMNNIFLVLNNNIFVMLVDHILMDFFHNSCISVASVFFSKFVSLDSLTFISALVDGLFVMGDHNWFFVVFLYMGMSVAAVIFR